MLKPILVSLCFESGAAVAQTGCLTDRDLSRGVVMEYAEGDRFEVSRGRNGNLVLVENYSDGSAPVQFEGAHALYIESEVELHNGAPDKSTTIRIDFGQPSATLPAPEPGGGFTVETTNIFDDGYTRSEIYTVAFEATTSITLGACTYDIIPANLRYSWPGESDGMNVEYIYFPQIGAAFLTASQFDGEDRLVLSPVNLTRRQK